jgi:hypothetical protein
MNFQEFPKWLYHAELAERILNTPEEAAALGDGWSDEPFAAATETKSPAPKKRGKKAE